MAKIVLISCASKKLNHRAKAKDLYISPLFKLNLKYAKLFNPDKIYILSAKHGLLDMEKQIMPYEQTLNTMPAKSLKKWAKLALTQLEKISDLKRDDFIFLAGAKYRKYLIPHIQSSIAPLEGLGIGKQLQRLKQNTRMVGNCHLLHSWTNGLKRKRFPFDKHDIPLNGIYVLFEKGELAHGTNRIVRIGTHKGENQLRPRLAQHFIKENKDRSIFRKNIGRAILSRAKDSFLEKWEIDLTTRESRKRYANSIDTDKQQKTEKAVTKYIQDSFSFVVFQVDSKAQRLELESKMISTVSLCKDCRPSNDWFGLHSPKRKIKESGLWLVNELWKKPLYEKDMEELKIYLDNPIP